MTTAKKKAVKKKRALRRRGDAKLREEAKAAAVVKRTRKRKPAAKVAPALRLNLGAGSVAVEGFSSVDIKDGQSAYPLPDYATGSVDEIRASHILEHFGEGEVVSVLREWMRVLKPGGRLRIAVPDFDAVVELYPPNVEARRPLRAAVIGGQTDANDFHRSLWTPGKLRDLMTAGGLECIDPWKSDVTDCASLPISLNLQGFKARGDKVVVAVNCPRIGFVDHMFAIVDALIPLGCLVSRYHGAFWNQGLTNLIEEAIKNGADFVVSVDYDTLFDRDDCRYLLQTISHHPHMDALCGLQIKREVSAPLCTVLAEDGESWMEEMPLSLFQTEFTKLMTAHFGLTVLRCSAFADLEKPWFNGRADPNGEWHDGRLDPDMNFWRVWREAGHTLYQANLVRLGHLQMMATWPTQELGAVHQYMNAFAKEGRPADVRCRVTREGE